MKNYRLFIVGVLAIGLLLVINMAVQCIPSYHNSLCSEPNGIEGVYLGYETVSIENDANFLLDDDGFSELYANSTMFYLDNKEWATFKIERDGVVGCNVSEAEFRKGLPECLYSCMGEVDPNEPVVIEWAEPNEVKE